MGWPFDELIQKIYLPHFQKHGEAAIPSLVTGSIARRSFLSAYKKLPPISKMPEKEKTEMKSYVNELFKGESPQFRLEACEIVYTIGSLI